MTQPGGSLAGTDLAMAPGEAITARGRPAWWQRPLPVVAWLLAVVVAFACYLRLARTRAVDSDGAAQALQAWDMLHGNLLLHGWWLSDVSFYTTELPQYMLVELVRGLNQDVVHVAAAMTYSLVVVLAALLAKGTTTGRAAVVRVAIAVGIMLAPQLSLGVKIFVSSPDHIGTSVPVLLVWLVLDRATPQWYVPALTTVLLGWAAVADTLVLYIGVLPLALVCAFRVIRSVTADRGAWRSQWYYLALGGGAVVAAVAARVTLSVIRAVGGFIVQTPTTRFAGFSALPHGLNVTGQGLLLLVGADFVGLRLGGAVSAVAIFGHLISLAVIALGVFVALRRFATRLDLVDQALVTAVMINLVAYAVSTQSGSLQSTREIAPVLPFCAALAGRLLADRVQAVRLTRAALALVLAGYVAGLGYELAQPTVPPQNHQLTSWLAAHHLRSGLSGYWEANVVTLTSKDRVRVRQLWPDTTGGVVPYQWESKSSWYDPSQTSANFVVLGPPIAEYVGFTDKRAVLATFGRPARTYHVGAYQVLVWKKNLLTDLR